MSNVRRSDADIRQHLDGAAACLFDISKRLDHALRLIDEAFDGYEPGYPYANSVDARAWDYIDAIHVARREIFVRLETWYGCIR